MQRKSTTAIHNSKHYTKCGLKRCLDKLARSSCVACSVRSDRSELCVRRPPSPSLRDCSRQRLRPSRGATHFLHIGFEPPPTSGMQSWAVVYFAKSSHNNGKENQYHGSGPKDEARRVRIRTTTITRTWSLGRPRSDKLPRTDAFHAILAAWRWSPTACTRSIRLRVVSTQIASLREHVKSGCRPQCSLRTTAETSLRCNRRCEPRRPRPSCEPHPSSNPRRSAGDPAKHVRPNCEWPPVELLGPWLAKQG